MDAQCNKLTTVIGQTKLTTLAMVDVMSQNFSTSRVWDKVPEGNTLLSGDTRIPLQHSVYNKPRVASVPKTKLIGAAILIQNWLVTVRQIEMGAIANTVTDKNSSGDEIANVNFFTTSHM